MKDQKIVCLVPTCKKNLTNRVPIVRRTWAKTLLANGVELFFVVGDPNTAAPYVQKDVLYVNCDDGKVGLAQKMFLALRWSLSLQYDYIAKFDDDTYVFPEFVRMEFTGDYIGHPTLKKIFEEDGKPFSLKSFLGSGSTNFVQESRARSFLHQDWYHLLDHHQGGAGYVLHRRVIQSLCSPQISIKLAKLLPVLPRIYSNGDLWKLLGVIIANGGKLSTSELAFFYRSEDNFIGFMMRQVAAKWVSFNSFCDYNVHYRLNSKYGTKLYDDHSCLITLHPFKDVDQLDLFHDQVLKIYNNNFDITPKRQAIRTLQYMAQLKKC